MYHGGVGSEAATELIINLVHNPGRIIELFLFTTTIVWYKNNNIFSHKAC